MPLRYIVPGVLLMCVVAIGCSKKHQPQTETSTVKTEEKKVVVKKVVKIPVSKVITVDDRAAKKSADERLYYDLEGRRYWRNYDDGKYYLYNKNMYNNPAFKPH
jgi:hypothetical protein